MNSGRTLFRLLLLCCCLITEPLLAQRPFRVKDYTYFDGLPSDKVLAVHYNASRLLFVVTERGVVAFDGYRFITLPGISKEIASCHFSGDTLYFEDTEGLKRLNIQQSGHLPEIIRLKNYSDDDPNNDHFSSLYTDGKRRLWYNDFNHIKYIGTDKEVVSFLRFPGRKELYTHIRFFEVGDSEIWIATPEGWLIWNEGTNTIEPHFNPALAAAKITAAFQPDGHTLVYATAEGTVVFFDLATHAPIRILKIPGKEAITGFAKDENTLLMHSYKNIWRVGAGAVEPLGVFGGEKHIRQLCFDESIRCAWLATDQGLQQLMMPHKGITVFRTGEKSAKPDAFISIVESHGTILALNGKGEIWELRSNGLQQVYRNRSARTLYSLSRIEDEIAVNASDGIFWFRKQVLVPAGIHNSIPGKEIVRTILTPWNELWVVYTKGQPDRYYRNSLHRVPVSFTNAPAFWTDNVWNDIAVDEAGTVWLAGWMPKGFGISYFDTRKQQFIEISQPHINRDAGKFVGDYYNRIGIGGNGRLYFSAFGGWNEINGKGKIEKRVDVFAYDIAGNYIKGISEDSRGNVFFATSEGLHIYRPELDRVVRLTTLDGLPENDLTNGYLQLYDGRILLGIRDGLVVIEPDAVLQTALVNKMELSQIMVNGKLQFVAGRKLMLEPEEHNITLFFSNLAYQDKGKVNYLYKLSDEKEWTEIGHTPEIAFNHIAPGTYQLAIACYDNLGNVQETQLVVDILARPPFTKSAVFYVLLGILITGTAFAVHRYILKKQQAEERYKRKLRDSEMQTLRAQMNPHFMFNTLNSINSYIIQNKTQDASKYLTSFARLMRNILDNSRQQTIPLKKEIQTLELYLELESARLEHTFEYRVVIAEGIDPYLLEVPPTLVQPFVENAIWHGILGRKHDGRISISFEMKDAETLHIIVEDNGIGRQKSREINRNKGTRHKSYGTEITMDRLKLSDPDNQVIIEDLYTGDELPAGTRVTLIIKIPLHD